MAQKTKTTYQLDSPFTSPQWPPITLSNQETILELLCSLLTPIGHHRTNHVSPSTGKRDKKRKRKEVEHAPVPPRPEIEGHVVVGLNNILRILEASSRASKPTGEKSSTVEDGDGHSKKESRHFSAVFVPDPAALPQIVKSTLPILLTTASKTHETLPPTRLVALSPSAAARLSTALGLPRTSIIGLLENAPRSTALIELIRDCVPELDVAWLKERGGEYKPLKVNRIETTNGTPKNSKEKAEKITAA